MHVRLKLLGTLPSFYPGYYPPAGLEFDLPAGATITDLFEKTGMQKERLAFVTINGLLARADDPIPENAVVKFIQPLAGG
jgi:hypothetical protein